MSEKNTREYIHAVQGKIMPALMDPLSLTPPFITYKLEENPDGQPLDIGPVLLSLIDKNSAFLFMSAKGDADFVTHLLSMEEYFRKSLDVEIPQAVVEIAEGVAESMPSHGMSEAEAIRFIHDSEVPFSLLAFAEHPSEREVPLLSAPYFVTPQSALVAIKMYAEMRLEELS